MHQDVAFRLLIQHVNVVVCQVQWPDPVTSRINDHRGGSSYRAARDQRRHQAYA